MRYRRRCLILEYSASVVFSCHYIHITHDYAWKISSWKHFCKCTNDRFEVFCQKHINILILSIFPSPYSAADERLRISAFAHLFHYFFLFLLWCQIHGGGKIYPPTGRNQKRYLKTDLQTHTVNKYGNGEPERKRGSRANRKERKKERKSVQTDVKEEHTWTREMGKTALKNGCSSVQPAGLLKVEVSVWFFSRHHDNTASIFLFFFK